MFLQALLPWLEGIMAIPGYQGLDLLLLWDMELSFPLSWKLCLPSRDGEYYHQHQKAYLWDGVRESDIKSQNYPRRSISQSSNEVYGLDR